MEPPVIVVIVEIVIWALSPDSNRAMFVFSYDHYLRSFDYNL